MKHRAFLTLVILLTSLVSRAAGDATSRSADSPFLLVLIDAKTEKALGPFPYDRNIYANAIEKAAAFDAKGVVLKFFLDQPKSENGECVLAKAMKITRVLLQARMDDHETRPNALPERFCLTGDFKDAGTPLSGQSGWLPIPQLAAEAHNLGFVDFRTADRVPVIERYRDRYVKSLNLCCLELALGQKAEIAAGKWVRIGERKVTLDERSEIGVKYPLKDDVSYISFIDFVNSKACPDAKNRVVIVGYDSDRFEPIETPIGKIRPHRAFFYTLMSLYGLFR